MDPDIDYEDDDEINLTLPTNGMAPIPSRVDCCLRFVYFILNRRTSEIGTQLDKDERSTYSAALHCMKRYFDGENDYGDMPPRVKRLDDLPEPTDEELRDEEERE